MDIVRVGYFIPRNGLLNGHPSSLYNTNYVCVSVKYRRPNGWADHDQIRPSYADRSGNGSYLIKLTSPPQAGVAVGILRAQQIKSPRNVMNCRENRYFLLAPPPVPPIPSHELTEMRFFLKIFVIPGGNNV